MSALNAPLRPLLSPSSNPSAARSRRWRAARSLRSALQKVGSTCLCHCTFQLRSQEAVCLEVLEDLVGRLVGGDVAGDVLAVEARRLELLEFRIDGANRALQRFEVLIDKQIGADLDCTQAGRGIRGEIWLAGAGSEDHRVPAIHVANRAPANVRLRQLLDLDGGHDPALNPHAKEYRFERLGIDDGSQRTRTGWPHERTRRNQIGEIERGDRELLCLLHDRRRADGACTGCDAAAARGRRDGDRPARAVPERGAGIAVDGALRSLNGNNTVSGGITLGTATRVNSDTVGNTLTLSGGITGTGIGLTVGGFGNCSRGTSNSNSSNSNPGAITEVGADSKNQFTMLIW